MNWNEAGVLLGILMTIVLVPGGIIFGTILLVKWRLRRSPWTK